MIEGQIPCVNVVELVTDWMEGGLDDDTRGLVEEHLVLCTPCHAYVDQLRQVIAASRRLDTEAPTPALRDELLQIFRAHRGR